MTVATEVTLVTLVTLVTVVTIKRVVKKIVTKKKITKKYVKKKKSFVEEEKNCKKKLVLQTKNIICNKLKFKWTADQAELCANTNANHNCTNFSEFFFLAVIFHLPVIYLYFTHMNHWRQTQPLLRSNIAGVWWLS